jgi:16S rRNA (guanine527-N7)-methyltransferase
VTEEEARAWLLARHGADRFALLERYVAALLAANASQNLIAKATEATVWTRHILDSAQLAMFAPDAETWLDIGSGPGLPGIVLAIVLDRPILLVEPRRKRVEFLKDVREKLGLPQVSIDQSVVERLKAARYAAVTARAYAPLPQLFSSTVRLTSPSTIWVLPKGRGAERELAEARGAWHGVFHVEQSLSDPDARIIVATDVRAAA